MSLAMRAGEKLIPLHNKGHLPPRQVTEKLLGKLGLRKFLHREHRETAALLAHYGFGATAGALLGVTAAKASSVPKPVAARRCGDPPAHARTAPRLIPASLGHRPFS
jgi:hypothetical protein